MLCCLQSVQRVRENFKVGRNRFERGKSIKCRQNNNNFKNQTADKWRNTNQNYAPNQKTQGYQVFVRQKFLEKILGCPSVEVRRTFSRRIIVLN